MPARGLRCPGEPPPNGSESPLCYPDCFERVDFMTSRTRSVWLLLVFVLPGWAFGQQTTDSIQLTTAQLQALSGEYTSAEEPDLPVSFYLQDGRLFSETERHVPSALTVDSATEFTDADGRYRFSLDVSCRASTVTVAYKGDPVTYVMARTGEAVHH